MSPTDAPLPLSVILPTHNRSGVLRRAIRSVLAQTRSPLELLVVDDCSTEDIHALTREFQDPRVRYLRSPTRGGPGAARNLGAREARGEWIAFQDSDDEWLITKLEQQWAAAANGSTDAALVCGAYIIVPRFVPPLMVTPTAMMRQRRWQHPTRFEFPFIAPTWLLRRALFLEVGGFDAGLPNLEDWELSFRLHERGGIITCSDPLLIKHGSADGLNQDPGKQLASLELIAARHAGIFARQPAIAAELALWRARLHTQLSQLGPARRQLFKALTTRPSARAALLCGAALAGSRVLRRAQSMLRKPGQP